MEMHMIETPFPNYLLGVLQQLLAGADPGAFRQPPLSPRSASNPVVVVNNQLTPLSIREGLPSLGRDDVKPSPAPGLGSESGELQLHLIIESIRINHISTCKGKPSRDNNPNPNPSYGP